MNAPLPPEKIGKYPVVRHLGSGATSEVYLCHDPFTTRDVAVKLVSAVLFNDPERGKLYRKLFVTEASLAGKLQHPHICQIFDAVADDDAHYIVMEHVDGGTLEKFCVPENLLPIDRAVEIVFKCTRALEFAHKMGITHRDIKPANILYTGETDVKITDFGAALISTGDSTQISAIGSPAYMSPQQVKEHPLDHRTDIYSMGVVMYHLLAGRLPFQASNNFSLIYQITNVEPAPPSSYRPQIPAALDEIVRRAMAKDLEQRYTEWFIIKRNGTIIIHHFLVFHFVHFNIIVHIVIVLIVIVSFFRCRCWLAKNIIFFFFFFPRKICLCFISSFVFPWERSLGFHSNFFRSHFFSYCFFLWSRLFLWGCFLLCRSCFFLYCHLLFGSGFLFWSCFFLRRRFFCSLFYNFLLRGCFLFSSRFFVFFRLCHWRNKIYLFDFF